jgi:methyl-accepting chemotaxis protein
MRIKDLTVSKKLIGVFSGILVVTAGLGLFSVLSLSSLESTSSDVRDKWMPSISHLGEFQYALTRYRVAEANFSMSNTETQREAAVQDMQKYLGQADKAWAQYLPTASSPEEKAVVARITAERAEYAPMQAKLEQTLKTEGKDAAISFFMGPMKKEFSDIIAAVDEDVAFNQSAGVDAGNRGEATYITARIAILAALALAIAMCVAAGIVLVRAVSRPLVAMTEAMSELAGGNLGAEVPCSDQADEIGQLADAMTSFKNQLAEAELAKERQTSEIVSSIGTGLDHLAKGNLTHRVTANLTGAFAKLKDDFNAAIGHLEDTMSRVLGATGQIATGAGEISQAADDLSRRTEQQAASLEETAAALEEITASVKAAASNSQGASRAIGATKKVAEDGGSIADEAVKAMDAIAQSSKQITEIIGVIDEIAFQTNLLALNAGVEAARAGDAGRGFAVVASEVRSLAQRSGEAAKQIKALINTSGTHVEGGVKLVGQSGEALRRIVHQVTEVDELARDSARASEQQASGIEQVNAAVNQMDQVTQQNAAMVEQSTASSRNLAGETRALSELVGFFKVGGRASAPTIRVASPARTQSIGRKQAALRAVEPADDWEEF